MFKGSDIPVYEIPNFGCSLKYQDGSFTEYDIYNLSVYSEGSFLLQNTDYLRNVAISLESIKILTESNSPQEVDGNKEFLIHCMTVCDKAVIIRCKSFINETEQNQFFMILKVFSKNFEIEITAIASSTITATTSTVAKVNSSLTASEKRHKETLSFFLSKDAVQHRHQIPSPHHQQSKSLNIITFFTRLHEVFLCRSVPVEETITLQLSDSPKPINNNHSGSTDEIMTERERESDLTVRDSEIVAAAAAAAAHNNNRIGVMGQ